MTMTMSILRHLSMMAANFGRIRIILGVRMSDDSIMHDDDEIERWRTSRVYGYRG